MMEKFKNGFIRFMYGRNGPDKLYRDSIIVYVALALINAFLRSYLLSLLMTALFVWMMFRCFSKNVYKRRMENEKYLQLTDKLRKKLKLCKSIITDKEHSFRKCSHCKTVMRLPRVKGEHSVVCPKCREKNTVKIR